MTLEQRIEDHRAAHRGELHIERLVQRQPPTQLDVNTGRLHQEPAAAIGMTMSGRLLKYVSHPDGYGSDFPWSRALFRLRYHCRKEHPFHRAADRPYWRGSLCWSFVSLVVIRGLTFEQAAGVLRYDAPEPVLRGALDFIEDSMDRARMKAERRAREDDGRFSVHEAAPLHHAPSPEHIRECPNPECVKRRAA